MIQLYLALECQKLLKRYRHLLEIIWRCTPLQMPNPSLLAMAHELKNGRVFRQVSEANGSTAINIYQ